MSTRDSQSAVTGSFSIAFSLVAPGAREIEEDLLGLVLLFLVHGADGVKKLIGKVAKHGGAARCDASLGSQDEEAGDIAVDGLSSVKLGELREKISGKVLGIAGRWSQRKTGGDLAIIVPETQARCGGQTREGAALAIGIAEVAAPWIVEGPGWALRGFGRVQYRARVDNG